ncbi:MAG: sensor histidine kinase, partial [Polyangiales bacterium]
YNVVDEDNRRIFGPSLRQAGDYLVAQRFPTTFYRWRLQVAPKQAPLLEAQGESRRINEAAMLVISLAIILIGITFLLYASLQERRLSALKSDFVANVSHELKTPLSAIRMFAELLWRRDAVDVSKRQQYAQIIHDEAERLSALIDNVLDFAALERGKITYRFIEDSVLPAVQRTVAALQARFERLGMTLQCSVEGEVAPLRFDPQAVALVLTNLVDNAIKHAGGRRIQVHLHYGARHLRLSVRDFGPGIATTERERIFERFYRSKDGARGRGSGIGLALVKSVAQAHGGQVFAGPRADGAPGAEVGLTLPLARSATAALSLPPPPPPSTPLSVAE